MAEDAESDIAIRFVDEDDYREISSKAVLAKRKLKKNRPSWFVSNHCYDLDSSEAESSSEEDEEVSASEEEAVTETESANEMQENEESSYSDDSSADEAKRRKSAGKPKPAPSSSTVTKSSKKPPKKSNKRNKSLSEEEMEDLCGQLEERRQDLDSKIREKIASSVNLEFYPSRAALRKELLADESVLCELTSEFIDEFIEVVRRVFNTNMAPRDKKAALAHEWSKKLKSFRDSEVWRKLCGEIPKNEVQEISRVDEIAVLSCIHEGIYDFIHSLSHENALSLPSQDVNTSVVSEDKVILHRFGGAALCRMIKLRQNTIKGKKGTLKVTDKHKEELEKELNILLAMKMVDKSSLPSEIKNHLDEGGLYFLKEEFMDFIAFADKCTRKFTVERTFRRSPSSFLDFVFTSVYGNSDIFAQFKSALEAVGINNESSAVKNVYEQLLTKVCRTRVKVFLQAMKERDLLKKNKVADIDVSLRDKLKGFVVRSKRK